MSENFLPCLASIKARRSSSDDKAIGRLALFSPKDDRFLALLDRRRLILVCQCAIDFRSSTSKVEKFDAWMEFKSDPRPVFGANVAQRVDRNYGCVGRIEGVRQSTFEFAQDLWLLRLLAIVPSLA